MECPAPPRLAEAFGLLLVIIVAYLNGLRGPFQFDDLNVIVHASGVHGLAAWRHAPLGIRPLLKLSYALCWQISATPLCFHLVNLALHALNTLLLRAWLGRLFPARVALAATLLWALHPALTEAVTYISGRSVSLMTTFWLLALLGRGWWSALAVAAAMAVRETAWIIPLLICLSGHLQGNLRVQQPLPALLIALAGIGLLLVLPAYRQELAGVFSVRPLSTQLLSQMGAFQYFLSGPILGLTPNIDPDIPLQTRIDSHWLFAALMASGVTGWCLWSGLRYRNRVAAGGLWFLLALLPTNSVLPRLDLASDRHLYPALIGPAWALALLIDRSAIAIPLRHTLAGLLFVATLIRNEDYRSDYALWLYTASQSPGKARVWNNLGYACEQGGDLVCAANAYRRALALAPEDSRIRLNLYFLENQPKTRQQAGINFITPR